MVISKREYARHLNSLEKSKHFARGVKAYMRKHRIPPEQYEEAAREYREFLEDTGSDLHHVAVFGETPDETEDAQTFSPKEADVILSELIEKKVTEGMEFSEAKKKVFSDPSLWPLVEAYSS